MTKMFLAGDERTLGYRKRFGNSIKIVVEHSDGPFSIRRPVDQL